MLDLFYGMEIPDQLRELAERHQTHIAELVGKLRTVGMDDHAIEAAVDQLIENYRTQLISAVKVIGGPHA
jgi:uncharacterized membrane-anchored protein